MSSQTEQSVVGRENQKLDSFKHRLWFVDGVSCLGKTTFVSRANAHGLKLDYAERSKAVPFFRQKDQSHVIQILYTATFGLEVLQRLDRLNHLRLIRYPGDDAAASGQEDRQTDAANATLFVDRSPISDVWYELLFKHYNDLAYQEQVFDHIEELNVFGRMPTIFVVPDEVHAVAICEKMRQRSNGLDRMDPEYVRQQIHVFDRVVERFQGHPNVRVIRVDGTIDIFSPDYFRWIANEFQRLTEITYTKTMDG